MTNAGISAKRVKQMKETEKKICTKCKENKPIKEYSDTVIGTKRGDCKKCESVYVMAYYRANKERIRENEAIRKNRQKTEKQKIIDKWKKI